MAKRTQKETEVLAAPSVPCAFSVRTWCQKYVELGERTLWEDIKQRKIAVVQRGTRKLITAEAMAEYLRIHTKEAFDAEAEARRILGEE